MVAAVQYINKDFKKKNAREDQCRFFPFIPQAQNHSAIYSLKRNEIQRIRLVLIFLGQQSPMKRPNFHLNSDVVQKQRLVRQLFHIIIMGTY